MLTMADGRQEFAVLQAGAVWGGGSEQSKQPEKLYGAEASAALRAVWGE